MSEQQPEAPAPVDLGYMSLPPEVQRACETGDRAVTHPPVAAALDREHLGRLVHEARLAVWAERYPSMVFRSWGDRSPRDREADMRMGEAVAAGTGRAGAQLAEFRSHLPAILDALSASAVNAEYECQAKPFRDALEALGGAASRD